MKKSLSCFLITCSIISTQPFFNSSISAKPVDEVSKASIITIKNNDEASIPKLMKAIQISGNQLEISYDRDVDMKLGTKATNYWIQDVNNTTPKGLATLGKNDKVNARNSLNDNLVKIAGKNGSANTFVLTFSKDIPKGEEYRLIICYVTIEGAPPYSGDNGMATFVGK